MSVPKVTAIITTCNSESYIAETIENITSQTLENIQIIFVDDASSDNTTAIITTVCNQDARVSLLVNTENKGAGYSRNRAVPLAQGEFIIFLDDDDIFHQSMLERAFQTAQDRQADVVVFRSNTLDCLNGKTSPADWTIVKASLPAQQTFTAHDTQHNFFRTFIWWAWDKLIKRQLISDAGVNFQEIRTSNDLFFVCATLLQARAITVCDEVLITHKDNRSGSLSNTRERSYDCSLQATEALWQFLNAHPDFHRFRCDFINYSIEFLSWSLATLKCWSAYQDFFTRIQLFYRQQPPVVLTEIDSEFLTACYQDLTGGEAESTLMKLKCRLEQDNRHFAQTLAECQRGSASLAAQAEQHKAAAEQAIIRNKQLVAQSHEVSTELTRQQEQNHELSTQLIRQQEQNHEAATALARQKEQNYGINEELIRQRDQLAAAQQEITQLQALTQQYEQERQQWQHSFAGRLQGMFSGRGKK